MVKFAKTILVFSEDHRIVIEPVKNYSFIPLRKSTDF